MSIAGNIEARTHQPLVRLVDKHGQLAEQLVGLRFSLRRRGEASDEEEVAVVVDREAPHRAVEITSKRSAIDLARVSIRGAHEKRAHHRRPLTNLEQDPEVTPKSRGDARRHIPVLADLVGKADLVELRDDRCQRLTHPPHATTRRSGPQ